MFVNLILAISLLCISTQTQTQNCESTVITKLPFTIKKSGNYCLNNNLTYSGTGTALTIEANAVTVNLNSHIITISNKSKGIEVKKSKNVTLNNGIIRSSTPGTDESSTAIIINHSTKVNLNKIYTGNTSQAFYADAASNDIKVNNSYFSNHTAAGGSVFLLSASNAILTNCVFNNNNPTDPQGRLNVAPLNDPNLLPKNCIIRNCQFNNTNFAINAINILI